ncbi:MAG TPA: cupredoxin family copper-binding protein [Rhizomicrobium sp.]|nr:cupredoxin family copper-binding protein [Rhizomicrobium sp.]
MIRSTLPLALFATLLIAPSVWAGEATIAMKNFDFSPMAITVSHGTTVVWKNNDGEPHTVVSLDGLFRSPALDQNDTFKFTFNKPGVYKYLCTIHPKMTGTITVD